jgi:hypothetical protein
MHAMNSPSMLNVVYQSMLRAAARVVAWSIDKPGVMKVLSLALTGVVLMISIVVGVVIFAVLTPLLVLMVVYAIVVSLLRSVFTRSRGPDYSGDADGRRNVRVLPRSSGES